MLIPLIIVRHFPYRYMLIICNRQTGVISFHTRHIIITESDPVIVQACYNLTNWSWLMIPEVEWKRKWPQIVLELSPRRSFAVIFKPIDDWLTTSKRQPVSGQMTASKYTRLYHCMSEWLLQLTTIQDIYYVTFHIFQKPTKSEMLNKRNNEESKNSTWVSHNVAALQLQCSAVPGRGWSEASVFSCSGSCPEWSLSVLAVLDHRSPWPLVWDKDIRRTRRGWRHG